MIPNMSQEFFPFFAYLRYFGAKLVHFRGDLWAMRWSVTPLKWVYRASRIFSIGGGLGSKPALLLETFGHWKLSFFKRKTDFSEPGTCPIKISPIIAFFKAIPMVYLKFIRNLVYREKLEEVAFHYGLTWFSFDAHSSDTAPPGKLIWPVSKSPRMDLSAGT